LEKITLQNDSIGDVSNNLPLTTSNDASLPEITSVYSQGQVQSNQVIVVNPTQHLKNSLDPDVLLHPDIFPKKIASKPTGSLHPYIFKKVEEVGVLKSKYPVKNFKYAWCLQKKPLGFGNWRAVNRKQKEKQQRFAKLKTYKPTKSWYCFHKMLPQRTTPCCKQCFHLAETPTQPGSRNLADTDV
jgi:hypothetical protein